MDYSGIKILVVDDEPDILEFITYNLSKEGFKVTTALNGHEALEVARRDHPHIMILDIMMPEMDGIELCHQIRSDGSFNNTIIAFLTARNEDFTQVTALDIGGDDFITKPIKPRLLISRIKALARRLSWNREQPNEDSRKVFGDLVIDRERYQVFIKDQAIDLAKKEFELLHLLASKPGKVFTREKIYSKIWGSDVIVGNRTIDVHIRKLREKLGNTYIKTIKGIGYKFDY